MEFSPSLERDEIYNRINQKTTFEFYFGNSIELGHSYRNPLRVDRKPGCKFFMFNGTLFFKDYSINQSYDLAKFISLKNGISYNKALLTLVNDNKIMLNMPKIVYEKQELKEKVMNFIPRLLSKNEAEYFKQFYINSGSCKKYNVVACQSYSTNYITQYYYVDFNPAILYTVNSRCKVYFYKISKDRLRFIGNVKEFDYFGYDELPWLGEKIIITKSAKDVLTLDCLGYNSISTQSETNKLDESKLEILKKRFKHIYIFYDYDKTGLESSLELQEKYPFLININTEDVNNKDISEMIKNKGRDYTLMYLKNVL